MTNGGASETNGIPSENNGDALLNCPNCGGGGKLTEEDVRRALFAHSTYASYDGLQLYANGIRTQEIANELNATLGGGECEQVLTDCDDGLMPPFTAHCSRCGVEWGFTPKHCHNCGARVTGTRDERKAVKR